MNLKLDEYEHLFKMTARFCDLASGAEHEPNDLLMAHTTLMLLKELHKRHIITTEKARVRCNKMRKINKNYGRPKPKEA